jgi:flagellar hook-basal body complex protein FliE
MISAVNTVSATAGMGSSSSIASSLQPVTGAAGKAAPFSDLIADAIGQVSQLETEAHTAVQGLMTGAAVDVHQAMIATEKASMAFELALAVRNKAVQAYQSVMGMQF